MRTISIILCTIGALSLAGCGGGSVSIDAGTGLPAPRFLFWDGSSGGTQVIDGTGHQFAFYADTGCLYNIQTGLENAAFCLAPTGGFVNYGAFHGQVANVLISNGTCSAAIIDSTTGAFTDIELDRFGREIVFTTDLHPALCAP